MTDILVGGIKYFLTCWILQSWNLGIRQQLGDTLYAVSSKSMKQGEIDIELGCETTVSQTERMVLLAVEEGVSLLDIGGSRVVDIWIEIPDARTIDAHIIT